MFETFKPSSASGILSKQEKLDLQAYHKAWCPNCQTVKDESDFWKGQRTCVECCKIKRKEWLAKNPNYAKEYKARDPEKWRKYSTEHNKKFRQENREYYNERDRKWRREWQKKYRANSPTYKIRHRLRESFRRFKNGKGGKKTFDVLGVESLEHFITLMSSKTNNPNWLTDGYHLDHIWQTQWFSQAAIQNPEIVFALINHHSNLRPLPAQENISRSHTDFSPLQKEDFPKFAPYLNPDIRQKLEEFFN
jgi:hypothetical protein